MFIATRIRLTIWYLLIIMLISSMFSVAIYRILTNELERGFHRISERYTQAYRSLQPIQLQELEPSYLQASESRILWVLIDINSIIFVVSAIGGYILAGVTLKPIRSMMEEQNRFITDASHELRTPITALKSEIEVYIRGKKHTVKSADDILKSNLEEVNNLQILSDSLIELAQQKKPQKQNSFTPVSLSIVVQNAVKKIQKAAKQKNIAIETKMNTYTVQGNEERLIQLFTLLLDNAVKYSFEKTTIKISAHQTDGSITIAIQDEGIGIEAKDIPHIFDRFYRADISRTKQEIPGYGLGLSIAKKIVTEHSGSIAVQSELHKGTTFTIAIPMTK